VASCKKIVCVGLALVSLSACTSGGGDDTGSAPTSGSPVVVAFGAGTNSGGIAGATPRFAFASNDDNTISHFIVASPNGQLRHNGYSQVGNNPGVVVVDPTGKFVYVPNQSDNNISAFAVTTDGGLTPIAGAPFAAGANPAGVAMHPSGKFLYVGNSNSSTVQGYVISLASGALTPVGIPNSVGVQPTELLIDPSGRFLYVANSGSNNISAFSIDASTGLLAPVIGSPFSAANTPVALAIDPKGRVLCVANLFSNVVTAFSINVTTGALGSPQSLGVGPFPTALTLDLTGQFLFVANGGDDSVSAFSIDQISGLVAEVAGSPFPTDITPVAILLDPSGKFVYVTNTDSSSVSIHSIDPSSGALALVQTARARLNPSALAFSAGATSVTNAPQYAYIANEGSNSISAYGINASSGDLAPVLGMPFGTGAQPVSITSDLRGRFVYAINRNSNNITAYQVSSLTGSLTAISGSPFAAGDKPVGIALDPTGRFLYVANGQSNDIAAYLVDSGNGVLSPNGANVSLGQLPTTLAIDPTGQFLFTGTDSGSIYSHRINPSTGSLVEVPGFPFPGPGLPPVPNTLLVDPTGKYIFSAGSSGLGGIYLRTINPSTGVLENGSNYGFSNAFTKQGLATDPWGMFLFVAYPGQSDVFSIAQAAPQLQRISGSPFGGIGDSVLVDPSGQYLYALDARCGATPCNGSIIAHGVSSATGSISSPTNVMPTEFLNLTMTITGLIQ